MQPVNWSNCITKSLSAVTYILIFIVPLVTETVVLIKVDTDATAINITVGVCSSIIAILAFIGGIRMAPAAFALDLDDQECGRACDEAWCGSPYECKSLLSAGHIVYLLPAWYACNQIAVWVHGGVISIPIQLVCYSAVPSYLIGMAIGGAIRSSVEYTKVDEESPVVGG